MENIVFSLDTEKGYLSEPIKCTNNIGINLEFLDGEKSSVILYQSITGIKYQAFKVDYNIVDCYDTIVMGIIADMYIQVSSSVLPTNATLLRK